MLTKRELEVLELLCKGYTNIQIADELFISVHTAKAHVSAVLRKSNVTNRTFMAYVAAKKNLIDIDIV